MSITDRDMGYRDLLAALSTLADEPYVTVGIHEDVGGYRAAEDGATVAEYATYNEFGMGVPERSFLRSTVDEEEDEIGRRMTRAITDQIDGRRPMRQGLARVGAYTVGKVKQKIRDLDTPPNAPATIAKKGSDNPLIESGRMRNSVDFEVHGSEPALGRIASLLRGR